MNKANKQTTTMQLMKLEGKQAHGLNACNEGRKKANKQIAGSLQVKKQQNKQAGGVGSMKYKRKEAGQLPICGRLRERESRIEN